MRLRQPQVWSTFPIATRDSDASSALAASSISERAHKSLIVAAVKKIAAELRNTPTVARKSYINPVVFTAWRDCSLHKAISEKLAGAPRKAEKLALAFLRKEARAARRS